MPYVFQGTYGPVKGSRLFYVSFVRFFGVLFCCFPFRGRQGANSVYLCISHSWLSHGGGGVSVHSC